jgi:hypothetical protein
MAYIRGRVPGVRTWLPIREGLKGVRRIGHLLIMSLLSLGTSLGVVCALGLSERINGLRYARLALRWLRKWR